jgi:hypothetical protein
MTGMASVRRLTDGGRRILSCRKRTDARQRIATMWRYCGVAWRTPVGDQTPEYWRAHAEEARTRADQMGNPEGKRIMDQIASLYDDMAVRAERESRYRSIRGHATEHVVHEQQQPQQQKSAKPDGEE